MIIYEIGIFRIGIFLNFSNLRFFEFYKLDIFGIFQIEIHSQFPNLKFSEFSKLKILEIIKLEIFTIFIIGHVWNFPN